MSKTSFQTNKVPLEDLLSQCGTGKIQLPDFQRSWVWAEDRIVSLIASISSAFPIGALMTLESRIGNDVFARRPVQGASGEAVYAFPDELLLDGQQRMTSLYQACYRRDVVETITPKNRLLRVWFYIDMMKALEPTTDRDEAIFSVREDRKIMGNIGRDTLLDLSEQEFEFEQLMFPLNRVFDWDDWKEKYDDYWLAKGDFEKRQIFKQFKEVVLTNFSSYNVPVIKLAYDTSTEAVCLVFEKVNTGGKPLDAFELLTAMYAAKGHKLRDDWLGTSTSQGLKARLTEYGRAAEQAVGALSKVASTDVIQAIALRNSKDVRQARVASGAKERELPPVRATRQSLLDLPLEAYLKYRDQVEEGFKRATKFLRTQNIHRVIDLPYQTQLVPLAAIFSEIGTKADHAGNLAKIARWFWCGIFGELYGSAIETRFAKDIVEVPMWLEGGPEPSTVVEGVFRADRLHTMTSRLSAAYKGIHALLMREGAMDFRSGQSYDVTVFFDEAVDIHHIFPQKWCKDHGIDVNVYDSVINKTPLGANTNRIIGGVAPSKYLQKLEVEVRSTAGNIQVPSIASSDIDSYLLSHCISPEYARTDNFNAFMTDRKERLLELISRATGHTIAEAKSAVDDGEDLSEELARDNDITSGQ